MVVAVVPMVRVAIAKFTFGVPTSVRVPVAFMAADKFTYALAVEPKVKLIRFNVVAGITPVLPVMSSFLNQLPVVIVGIPVVPVPVKVKLGALDAVPPLVLPK